MRAAKFGGVWRFQGKSKDDVEWTYYDVPLLDDLLKLKDIVLRKYQRRRASADDVASVEKLIQERSADDPPSPRLQRAFTDGDLNLENAHE